MSMIEITDLTKDYGGGKGVYDVNLTAEEGEVYGFLGPNGAGKTTTIRHLLGFIRPDSGTVKIGGLDCFADAPQIHKELGYLAGELAFFDDLTGRQMIDFMADMKGVKDHSAIEGLLRRFDLDAGAKICKMSKGMKQKVGIVCAFMHDPKVIILDEPTSGLDPLMQNALIELVLEEKQKGKTVFMSSHIFEEVERTCDRTAMIRNGRIVTVEDMESLRAKKQKSFVITFADPQQAVGFCAACTAKGFHVSRIEGAVVTVLLAGSPEGLLKTLAGYAISDLDVKSSSLEEIFLQYYGGEQEAAI